MPSRRRSNTNILTVKRLKKWTLLFGFYGFSVLVLLSGLALCLTKPPADQAQHYIAAAQYYQDHLDSVALYTPSAAYLLKQRHDALSQAASLTPYNPEIWNLLVQVHQDQAKQAQASHSYLPPQALILSRNDL